MTVVTVAGGDGSNYTLPLRIASGTVKMTLALAFATVLAPALALALAPALALASIFSYLIFRFAGENYRNEPKSVGRISGCSSFR